MSGIENEAKERIASDMEGAASGTIGKAACAPTSGTTSKASRKTTGGIRAMMSTDLTIMRGTLASTAGLSLVIVAALAIGMQSLTPALAAVSAMVPLMALTTLGAYDEYNGWGSFRLALPLSRQQVVLGRYASLLAIAAVTGIAVSAVGCIAFAVLSLVPGELAAQLHDSAAPMRAAGATICAISCVMVACAITLPLAMHMGMTNAVRFVPVFAAVIFALGLAMLGSSGSPLEGSEAFANLLLWLDASNAHLLAGSAVILAASLALYAASAVLATRLYETREL